ncbi:flavodoxin domain-containing protein [Clostridium akagii]|uniref:flavodoxin domain-containing protein n=1 Tax=Clostridium akagii TaxID=91623 RepID=UPI00047ACF4A|nr:flavodoxin domain-containing protein [Clostridium akagii]
MKTLIVYATKHEFTKNCVVRLSEKLHGNVDIFNLKEDKDIVVSDYDNVIIGGPIYMGQMIKEVKQFCLNNSEALTREKIGLFVCGMSDSEKITSELNQYFPETLISNATIGIFGGAFVFKNMNFFERLIIKLVSKTNEDMSNYKEKDIDEFAEKMNSESSEEENGNN